MKRRRLVLVWIVVAMAAAAVGLLYDQFLPGLGSVSLRPDDPRTVALGGEIYRRECAACHGANLEGQPNWRQRLPSGHLPAPPHDETGHTWHHPDRQLFELTKFGPAALAGSGYESDMPAYEAALDDGEILAVLSYIKSRWPEAIRSRHDQLNAQAAN